MSKSITRTKTRTRTITIARTELVIMNVIWTLAEFVPKTEQAQEAIRIAIERGQFQAIRFYAVDDDELCFGVLKIALDAERHQQYLQVASTVEVPDYWREQISPQLRPAIEQFKRIVEQYGLQVRAKVKFNDKGEPPVLYANGRLIRPTPPPRMAGALKEGEPAPIDLCDELTISCSLVTS